MSMVEPERLDPGIPILVAQHQVAQHQVAQHQAGAWELDRSSTDRGTRTGVRPVVAAIAFRHEFPWDERSTKR